jgi:hypothetical protein
MKKRPLLFLSVAAGAKSDPLGGTIMFQASVRGVPFTIFRQYRTAFSRIIPDCKNLDFEFDG